MHISVDNLHAGIVGYGSAGKFLHARIKDSLSQDKLAGIYDISEQAVKDLDENICTDLITICKKSNVIFICSDDNNILDTAKDVLKIRGDSNVLLCHLSGSMRSEIFLSIQGFSGGYYSIHPAIPILSGIKYEDPIIWGIEGQKEFQGFFSSLIDSFGDNAFILHGIDKGTYHFACVFFCNLLLFIHGFSRELLISSGMDKDSVSRFPKIQEKVLLNYLNEGEPGEFLTGPVFRGDVELFSEKLRRVKDRELKRLYLEFLRTFVKRHSNSPELLEKIKKLAGT